MNFSKKQRQKRLSIYERYLKLTLSRKSEIAQETNLTDERGRRGNCWPLLCLINLAIFKGTKQRLPAVQCSLEKYRKSVLNEKPLDKWSTALIAITIVRLETFSPLERVLNFRGSSN